MKDRFCDQCSDKKCYKAYPNGKVVTENDPKLQAWHFEDEGIGSCKKRIEIEKVGDVYHARKTKGNTLLTGEGETPKEAVKQMKKPFKRI
jgi:hypothetical protein